MSENLDLRRELMERARVGGVESLSDEELLAALLTYCRTKDEPLALAEAMLSHFGGLRGLTDSGYEEMAALKGINKDQALFLWTVRECAERAARERRASLIVSSPEDAVCVARRDLALCGSGTHLALYLDKDLRFLDISPAAWTGADPGSLSEFEVLARCAELGCGNVILLRNKAAGGTDPERQRRRDLNYLGAMRRMDVTLLDIITVGGDGFISLDREGFFDWEVEEVRKRYRGKGAL